MTAQPDWGITYINKVRALVAAVQECRTQYDILQTTPGLAAGFASAANNPRPDLVALDFTNANAALGQLFFTLDSGSPLQKSYLYKIL